MHEPFMKAGSRGSSILGSILLLAVSGSAATAVEPLFPFESMPSQLAASSLAFNEGDAVVPSTAQPVENAKTQEDSIGATVVDFRDQVYNVYYACRQETNDKENIGKLLQTCQPGFLYSIRETDGIIWVLPTPGPTGNVACPSNTPARTGSCSNPASPNPVLSCWNGQPSACAIWYTMSGEKPQFAGGCSAGEPIDLAKSRLIGLQKTVEAADPGERPAILTNAGVDPASQSTVMNSFKEIETKEQAVEKVAADRANITKQLNTLAGCTSRVCAEQASMLKLDDVALASQQQALRTQLDGLKDNTQRLLAGESPPGGYVPSSADRIPSQLDFARNTTGFNGSGFIGSPEAQPSSRDNSYLTSLQEGIADSALSFNDMVKSVLGGAIPAAARGGGAVALSSGGNPYLIAGGLLVGTTCYYYCPGVVESIPETLSPEARQERAREWTSSIEKAGTRVLGGIYTGYSTVRDWWYGPSTMPPASVAQAPRVSELPGQQVTDRDLVPTNVAGRAPSITTMPPIARKSGVSGNRVDLGVSRLTG